jgi:hypothetical protein
MVLAHYRGTPLLLHTGGWTLLLVLRLASVCCSSPLVSGTFDV